MNVVEIPLRPIDQTFRVSLAGRTYVFRVMWNPSATAWFLDIADFNNTPLLSAIPLVTGLDLLSPYPYVEFGGALFVRSDAEPDAVPDQLTLGTEGHLYFVTPTPP